MSALGGRVAWWLAIAAGIAAALFFAFGKPPPQSKPVPESLPVPVDVVALTLRRHPLAVHAQGTVRSKRRVQLAAQVGGVVRWVSDSFVDGGFISRGEVMLRLEADDYEIVAIRAKAQVANAERELATMRGEARRARQEWVDLNDVEANALFLRKPQTRSAEASLAAAKAELRQAELNVARTRMRAPFDARIQTTRAELGQFLTPGAPVANIYATAVAEVRLPLTDRDASMLALPFGTAAGQRAAAPAATISAVVRRREWTWPAHIVRSEAGLDAQSRVLYAVAEISDPYLSDASGRPPLMVGQYVAARIAGQTTDETLKLPQDALRVGDVIWIMDDDQRLRVMPVEFVYGTDSAVFVRPSSDRRQFMVVVSQLALAAEGMRLAPGATELGAGAPGTPLDRHIATEEPGGAPADAEAPQ